jgi:Phosphoenolpyruvate phosphomutase
VVGRPDLEETTRRLQAYADAGADCLYAPWISTADEVSAIVTAVAPKPGNLLVNKPFITVAEAASLGVRRIRLGGTLAPAPRGPASSRPPRRSRRTAPSPASWTCRTSTPSSPADGTTTSPTGGASPNGVRAQLLSGGGPPSGLLRLDELVGLTSITDLARARGAAAPCDGTPLATSALRAEPVSCHGSGTHGDGGPGVAPRPGRADARRKSAPRCRCRLRRSPNRATRLDRSSGRPSCTCRRSR